ncbi:hypothetical protein J27TS8_35760 [Robertmurraya siralis]|uniref:Uncharacterized protein n=1 Tax=Robertmurraya siralis TaxID=77777 RepID=A0A919WK82_9BACI|nr:hypothetical protein [Robertmurraya siralis]GIN63583.1 hypothetical protein J27TS8_35760 [Robertmurraya siralis]
MEQEITGELKDHLPLKGLHELKTILAKQKECIDEEDGLETFSSSMILFIKLYMILLGEDFYGV